MGNGKKVTIVTVVLNNPEGFDRTANSILNQTSKDYEWIVMDGGSRKETLDVIELYRKNIDIFVSKRDKGIYDAMNKGVERSNGEWILFMNAGDELAFPEVLSSFAPDDHVPFAYGDAKVISEKGPVRWPVKNLKFLRKGICFSHQSTFFRAKYLGAAPYNTKFKVVADYELYVRLMAMHGDPAYLGYTISLIEPGGYSEKAARLRTYERYKVARRYFQKLSIAPYYFWLYLGKGTIK